MKGAKFPAVDSTPKNTISSMPSLLKSAFAISKFSVTLVSECIIDEAVFTSNPSKIHSPDESNQ